MSGRWTSDGGRDEQGRRDWYRLAEGHCYPGTLVAIRNEPYDGHDRWRLWIKNLRTAQLVYARRSWRSLRRAKLNGEKIAYNHGWLARVGVVSDGKEQANG